MKIIDGTTVRIMMESSNTAHWRWECNSTTQLCERIPVRQYDEPGEPLKTCQMKCGPVPIWPLPTVEVLLSNKSVTFNYEQLEIKISALNKKVHRFIASASEIFVNSLRPRQKNSFGIVPDVLRVIVSVNVFGNSSEVIPRLHVDESYKFEIFRKNLYIMVNIKSNTFLGARHALETLSQLIWYDSVLGLLRVIETCKVVDFPAFTYRGLLLDTTHHYIPVSSLERTITAMAFSKMNYFHWYMMGPQSFPFYYESNPNMAIHGAFSSKELYTKNDIKRVVEFAALRGIKVLIEIENPGHSEKSFHAMLNTTKCFSGQLTTMKVCSSSCKQRIPEPYFFYRIMKEIFLEIENVTSVSDLQHLGGRNLDMNCLKNSVDTTLSEAYRKQGTAGVVQYFQKSMYDLIKNRSTSVPEIILWADYFKNLNGPTKVFSTKTYIAQINGNSELNEAKSFIDSGYRVIISNMDKWALDRFPIWKTVYDHRPWLEYSWSQRQKVLGGECSLWSHTVDEHSLDNVVWPNAAVVGEVLWSDSQTDSLPGVRLEIFREYLVERGIMASVVSPKWCLLNPGMCA